MEEAIKKTAHLLNAAFAALWTLAVALVVAGECQDELTGLYADNGQAIYVAETSLIGLTAVALLTVFKLHERVLTRRISRLSLPQALRLYARWGVGRLAVLAFVTGTGLVVYYLMLSTTGLLCALIGLTTSFFCLPGEKRLRKDLHIEHDQPSTDL